MPDPTPLTEEATDDPRAEYCFIAGHEWVDAGGGLEICMVCQSERWAEEGDGDA